MTTLHEQAVEAMAEATLTALGSYKRTMGDVAGANLKTLLSLIKDNEELVDLMAKAVSRNVDNHISITCDPDTMKFTVVRLVSDETLAGPFSEIEAADDARDQLILREGMSDALAALTKALGDDGD